jgi:hypothetical protein
MISRGDAGQGLVERAKEPGGRPGRLQPAGSDLYQFTVDSNLVLLCNDIESGLTTNQVNALSTAFDDWLDRSISGLPVDSFATEPYQHFFYYYSLGKILARKKTTGTCECDEYQYYLIGKSSFQCEQDIIIDVSLFRQYSQDSIDRFN